MVVSLFDLGPEVRAACHEVVVWRLQVLAAFDEEVRAQAAAADAVRTSAGAAARAAAGGASGNQDVPVAVAFRRVRIKSKTPAPAGAGVCDGMEASAGAEVGDLGATTIGGGAVCRHVGVVLGGSDAGEPLPDGHVAVAVAEVMWQMCHVNQVHPREYNTLAKRCYRQANGFLLFGPCFSTIRIVAAGAVAGAEAGASASVGNVVCRLGGQSKWCCFAVSLRGPFTLSGDGERYHVGEHQACFAEGNSNLSLQLDSGCAMVAYWDPSGIADLNPKQFKAALARQAKIRAAAVAHKHKFLSARAVCASRLASPQEPVAAVAAASAVRSVDVLGIASGAAVAAAVPSDASAVGAAVMPPAASAAGAAAGMVAPQTSASHALPVVRVASVPAVVAVAAAASAEVAGSRSAAGAADERLAAGAALALRQSPGRQAWMTRTLIHRFWYPERHGTRVHETLRTCMRSFRSDMFLQFVWTYSEADFEDVVHGGGFGDQVFRMDAGLVLSQEERRELLLKMQLQHVKDAFSFAVVQEYGGWFVDLDYVWLGKPLPQLSDYPAGTENLLFTCYEKQSGTHMKAASKVLSIDGKPCAVNLGVVHCSKYTEFAAECYHEFEKKHPKVQRRRELPDGEANMARRRELPEGQHVGAASGDSCLSGRGRKWTWAQDAVQQLAVLRSRNVAIVGPDRCCGLPYWLRKWPASASESPVINATRLPSLSDLSRDALMLNVWHGVWPDTMVACARDWARTVRLARTPAVGSAARAVELAAATEAHAGGRAVQVARATLTHAIKEGTLVVIEESKLAMEHTGMRLDVAYSIVGKAVELLHLSHVDDMILKGPPAARVAGDAAAGVAGVPVARAAVSTRAGGARFLTAADILHRSLAAALLCQAAKLVWRVCDVADGSPSLCIVLRCIIRSLRVSAQPIDLDQWYLNSGGAIE